MNMFSLLLILGSFLLFISAVSVSSTMPHCNDDLKICPDGTKLSRDPLNNCSFSLCPYEELFPYCTKNVLSVEKEGSLIRTVSSLLGGGFTVYSKDNVTDCFVVGPSYISKKCKEYSNFNWSIKIDCSKVDNSYSFRCPTNYYKLKDYKWINCSNEEFKDYCNNKEKQWIKHNCNINFVN